MARTKQTARGSKSSQPTRQPGMEAEVIEQQQEEVQVDEDVAPEGAEGEVQKEARRSGRSTNR